MREKIGSRINEWKPSARIKLLLDPVADDGRLHLIPLPTNVSLSFLSRHP